MNPDIKAIQKTATHQYSSAGFERRDADGGRCMVFHNRFSVHFVWVLTDIEQLAEQWQALHDQLVDEYRQFKGPIDAEWNFYTVFLIAGRIDQNEDAKKTRQTIENNTSYSRKFVFGPDELDHLPPGAIDPGSRKLDDSSQVDPLEAWEATLGEDLYALIDRATTTKLSDAIQTFVDEVVSRGK
jgi:hypothetical protein